MPLQGGKGGVSLKLLFIIGNGAVGKMTVGQELMKRTRLRLFHNHMSIELVLEVLGRFDAKMVNDVREAVFKNYAASDNYGLIFTYMWAFDMQEDWDYIEHVKEIFAPYGTEFYYVELIASQEVRLARNETENRLKNKASKRDIQVSSSRLLREDGRYRLVSREGEIPFENYFRLDNTEISPERAAEIIQERFGFE